MSTHNFKTRLKSASGLLLVAAVTVLMASPTTGHAFGRRKPSTPPAPVPTQTPTPTPTTTPTPTPTVTPGPTGMEGFSIFYGYPSDKRTPWGAVRVLPEAVQFPQHEEYELAKQVLREARLGCGYIPLGQEPDDSLMYEWQRHTSKLTMAQFKADIQRWKAMGANCIFVDTAGKDYGNTEARVMEAHDAIHAAGMQVMWNAWEPLDLPWHRFNANDHFLFESAQGELDGDGHLEQWFANRPAGARGYAVVTKRLSTTDQRELTDMMTRFGISGIQWRNDDRYTVE